jgi:hypothetical protein
MVTVMSLLGPVPSLKFTVPLLTSMTGAGWIAVTVATTSLPSPPA